MDAQLIFTSVWTHGGDGANHRHRQADGGVRGLAGIPQRSSVARPKTCSRRQNARARQGAVGAVALRGVGQACNSGRITPVGRKIAASGKSSLQNGRVHAPSPHTVASVSVAVSALAAAVVAGSPPLDPPIPRHPPCPAPSPPQSRPRPRRFGSARRFPAGARYARICYISFYDRPVAPRHRAERKLGCIRGRKFPCPHASKS